MEGYVQNAKWGLAYIALEMLNLYRYRDTDIVQVMESEKMNLVKESGRYWSPKKQNDASGLRSM